MDFSLSLDPITVLPLLLDKQAHIFGPPLGPTLY